MRKQAEYELYKRLKLLGEGSFGKAYLVECLQDKSLWVTKYMDLAAMTQQEKDETLREAKILEFLTHPNIVKFREVYKTKKGRLCIVMEYADGGDLSQKIKETKGKNFPETQILDWFTQICLAIKHVHDRKIIHRDLKGQNIFLTKTGQVKLGDFGIARILKKTVEKAKTMVGTPYYISPEIIEGKPYTFQTDIWSLGVILYELCALQPPFNADSLHFLALNIVKGQYKPIPTMYSKELKTLLALLLQVDYRRRPTIQEILKMPVITNRIKSFLSETIQKQEFSHTVLHNRAFEIKGNLDQVNLILNEQPCPAQLLQQNAKNLQEFPDIIKKVPSEDGLMRPPQLGIKPTKPVDKPEPPKQIDIPPIQKKQDPITKNSPLQQQKKEPIKDSKDAKKPSPQQIQPSRPKSDLERQQQRSEPCRFDAQVQKKHSSSEQALLGDQQKKVEQFASPKVPQKLDGPRPPTAPKEKPKPPLVSQRPQSSRPQQQEVKKGQKIVIEKRRPTSVDKLPQQAPPQPQLEQQSRDQQRQEERIRQLKLKQEQQEQMEKERKLKQIQQEKQQLLEKQQHIEKIEKQKQLERQQERDRQLEKQQQQERQKQLEKQQIEQERQRELQIQKDRQKELDQLFQLEKQPSEKSPKFGGKQSKESRQQIKPKSDLLEKVQEKNKDFDLMLKELEGLLSGVNNAIDKFPVQNGKENYFDYNTMAMQPLEDRDDDDEEPLEHNSKKIKQVKQISKEEEECLDLIGKKNMSTLKAKLETALGQEKLLKAMDVLQTTINTMQLDEMERKYGPAYEKLLPFLTLEERKKFVPLILTFIIAG